MSVRPAMPRSSPNKNHHNMATSRTPIHGLRLTTHSTRSTATAAASSSGSVSVTTTKAVVSITMPRARRA